MATQSLSEENISVAPANVQQITHVNFITHVKVK